MEVMERNRTTPTAEEALLWIDQYRRPLVVLALIVIVAAAFVGLRQWSNAMRENEVNRKIGEAPTLDSKLQVASQYLGTEQSALALLLIASEQNINKDFTGAAKTYHLFLDHYQGHPLHNAARLGLAFSEELGGQTDAALKDFLETSRQRPADNYNALGLLNAARIYQTKSNFKSAREVLSDCSAQFHNTIYGRQAAEKLKALPSS
jgi:hypothetical protein